MLLLSLVFLSSYATYWRLSKCPSDINTSQMQPQFKVLPPPSVPMSKHFNFLNFLWAVPVQSGHEKWILTGKMEIKFPGNVFCESRCHHFHRCTDAFGCFIAEIHCGTPLQIGWLCYYHINLERQIFETDFSRWRRSLLYLLRELHLWLKTFTFPRKLSLSLRPPCPIRSVATTVCPIVSLKLARNLCPPSPIRLLAFATLSRAWGGCATQANKLGLEPITSEFLSFHFDFCSICLLSQEWICSMYSMCLSVLFIP